MPTEALQQIKNLLGPAGIIDDPARMQAYLTSWRNGWEGKSPFIALPADTKQVSEIVKICRAGRIAIVPQGGNTGLVGGGIPSAKGDELVVNLSRMNKIRLIDATGSVVIAEAGVILQTLQEEADRAGFLFPLRMASEGSAEVGGAISTNAGGTAVLRYGNMRESVLGLEAVLPDGEILSNLGTLYKDNTGYNLNQYFIGAEGTLGLITAAALKLFPKLNQTVTAVAAIGSAEDAMELLRNFRGACGEHLNAFEIISLNTLRLVVKNIPGMRFPVKDDAPYYLLIELGSSSGAIRLRDVFEDAASQAMESGRILDAVIAESATQAKQLWALRENASEALRHEGSGLHFDISLPLAEIAGFLGAMTRRIESAVPDIFVAPFGHIGDGNIHYNMRLPKQADAGLKKSIQDMVYAEVAQLKGSLSAEHGVGVERKEQFGLYKSRVAIAVMKKIKLALDPDNLMNPGKVFDII